MKRTRLVGAYTVLVYARDLPRKTPLLERRHVIACLEFAEFHKKSTFSILEKELWSDETEIKLFEKNTSTHVWRKMRTALDPKNTIPTVKKNPEGAA